MKEGELKNRRIIVKNIEDDTVLADTVILRFNSDSNSVMIHADSLSQKKFCNISAMIFAEKCLYEVRGTIRRAVVENEVEVYLGKSRKKESRTKTRYPVAIEGDIRGVYIDEREIPLYKKIQVKILNMSANGILLSADMGYFNIGEVFSLTFKTPKGTLGLRCEIVRIQNYSCTKRKGLVDCRLQEEYGCRIREAHFEKMAAAVPQDFDGGLK